MKRFFSLVFCIALFVRIAPGQNQTPSLQPTPLEAFAALPATRVAWSNELVRIDSSEAHAVVTALILEDSAQPPDRMLGIRIDLFSADSKDKVYLGEETLGVYKNALDEIAMEATRQRNEGTARDNLTPEGTSYVGAGVFWYADRVPRVHALSAAHYFGPDSSGLYVHAFKGIGFRFPNQDACQLSLAIGRAMQELKNR
jgi:hypothetical protein